MRDGNLTFNASDFLISLREAELLSELDAMRVQEASSKSGTPIEAAILELGLMPEGKLFVALAEHLRCPYLAEPLADSELLAELGLSAEFLRRVGVLAIRGSGDVIQLVTCRPSDMEAIEGIRFYLGLDLPFALTRPSALKAALDTLMGDGNLTPGPQQSAQQDVEKLRAMAQDGPIIKLVNELIGRAVARSASDIHIEANETGARVRFRCDGILQVDGQLSPTEVGAVVSRLKIMAKLNISERRRPQDGRAELTYRGRVVDIRLSCLPTQYGESLVLRLLDKTRLAKSWEDLGFLPDAVSQIRSVLAQPNGIFLVAGPTGSGKTTTLYTALSQLNSPQAKIVSVEDPVEYALDGVNQTQVEPEIGLDFAAVLRAILRQDPDIVMIGEIRDEETAKIAVRSALIGRLVLSTVHTNDSVAAIDRLFDLGVPAYLLGSTLRGVLSQRLVRTVCTSCKGRGCGECDSLGLRGRVVVSEFLSVSERISRAISTSDSKAIRSTLDEEKMQTMNESALTLINKNLVSEVEVIRALGPDWRDSHKNTKHKRDLSTI